ncbi:MAG: GNAT family N-acetyltransferase [Nanoarchaeota archaeon]
MKIRQAKFEDKIEFLKLVRGLYGRGSPQSVKEWEKNYESMMCDAAVAEEENKIVGYIAFWIQEDGVYISDLYVLPKFRRKGIAGKLLQTAENFSEKVSRDLRVDARKKDYPAQKLYYKHQFKYLEDKNSMKLIKRMR